MPPCRSVSSISIVIIIYSQEGYYLRPEMVESVYYLYRATKDPLWLILGETIVESLDKVGLGER